MKYGHCESCGEELCCHCGTGYHSHSEWEDGHSFTPLICDCHQYEYILQMRIETATSFLCEVRDGIKCGRPAKAESMDGAISILKPPPEIAAVTGIRNPIEEHKRLREFIVRLQCQKPDHCGDFYMGLCSRCQILNDIKDLVSNRTNAPKP